MQTDQKGISLLPNEYSKELMTK